MIIPLNPSQVILQIAAISPDGTPKTDVSSGSVRVYHIDATGAEVDDLVATSLVRVGVTNIWRYQWKPVSLAVRDYTAQYTLVDTIARTFNGIEDIFVRDIATQADLTIVKKIETGRWKIVGNQMLFYDDDGLTVLYTFNLKDAAGSPTMTNVFERVIAP